MFPMKFDHKTLETLPVPDSGRMAEILKLLKTIVNGRVIAYFKRKRGTDPTLTARLSEQFLIRRIEDEENRIPFVSLLSRRENIWLIDIHERIFDYLAFVIPSAPESRLGGRSGEEGKILAFIEFVLRHQVEHMLYPEKSERVVIRSDLDFAMDRRRDDPTYYAMLRKVLSDEMNGLSGELYQSLFESEEQGRPHEYLITRMLTSMIHCLVDIPGETLCDIFSFLATDLKTRLMLEYYRKSRETSHPLMQRAFWLREVLRFFALTMEQNDQEAEKVFDMFKDRWGLVYLFHELGLPDNILEEKEPHELFSCFKKGLEEIAFEDDPFLLTPRPPKKVIPEPTAMPVATKSLKDRIEEARLDPSFSRQALDVIDKNQTSAVGHSGPKYTELIETLLAIPWGHIQEISVDARGFEEGLNRTHYGLSRPKEIVCDFFANLIWRYQHAKGTDETMHRCGSAFLFVGPPGVGKTSLAISIAENLGIPYHKVSLGGMREESGLRGHGFTYEGSKPGAIVQGLIKMGIMNGMFILDETDKTEPAAVSTLLEILDPEQNHLFHDKYTMTTVDVDLSNCHFILTANTLETVPPPVINRCEVVLLDRYSIEEKIAIGRKFLIGRVRKRHDITQKTIALDPDHEIDLMRYLIKTYTHEPGVRELERIIRTLFLRIFRKEILGREETTVLITREKIKEYLETPTPPRQISEEDRAGEILGLGVNVEMGIGSVIPIQATLIRIEKGDVSRHRGYLSMVHATGNIEKIMDESRKVATTAILHCADALGVDLTRVKTPIHLHFMGSSTRKDGPSAGGAIALALASALSDRVIRRDVAMTGEVDTQGRITAVGGLDVKLETACDAGCRTMIIPTETLEDEKGVKRLPEALKKELQILTYESWKDAHEPFDYRRHVLQVVAVDHVVQAARVAFIDQDEITALTGALVPHAVSLTRTLAKKGEKPGRHLCILYVKDPGELTLDGMKGWLMEDDACIILYPEGTGEAVRDVLSHFKGRMLSSHKAPSEGKVAAQLRDIVEKSAATSPTEISLSVIAPFFFLENEGITAQSLFPEGTQRDLRLFANNYTAQDLKIKGCKAALNRVLHHLRNHDPADLADCPFLTMHHGIHVVDLSFIPEKYRLDVKRAEKILNGSLREWLKAVEDGCQYFRPQQ
ncbi:putative ATP-dependent protease La [delta proteobacterium NaphS2]|nr:putative ATP-dependent protease La [delta proteobacterium NaphS2]